MSIIEGIRNAEMNLQIGILLCQYNIAFLFCDLRTSAGVVMGVGGEDGK